VINFNNIEKMKNKFHLILVGFFLIGLIVSAIEPKDYFTWLMEVFPAIIGFLVLVCSYPRFKFSKLTYVFILIHCYILFVGGHYTYAEVPLFDTLKDWLHQDRNNYDKVGHFAQGFVPAMITKEVLIRKHVLQNKAWLPVFTVCICMAISVLYEFLEWGVAICTGESADAFLGTQGYVWDTQSDMLYAAIGAICMFLFVRKKYRHKIEKSEPVFS
jgi:putative membrane protein